MRVWIAIWVGSTTITHWLAAWIAGGAVLRLLVIGLAAGFAKGLPFTTALCWLAALAWLGLAILLGLRQAAAEEAAKTTPKDGATDAESAAGAEPATVASGSPKATTADPTRDDVASLLHDLLGDTGGVHLSALAKALPGGPWPTRKVRSLLASHGTRVRAGVRGPTGAVREGVHRDDIPTPTSPTGQPPTDAAVAAGQSNNNNDNNAEPVPAFTVTDDPDDPARSHVHFAKGAHP
ncbi:hypothetical protein [Streptomyces sp. NRRL S-1813]|uniref:hypothetical protein n=1 Tax=Streptomyces sp. NRRL S-1813 TaxID=1463888 RepID=UPI0004C50EF4|nr:hypothetical protein [Streptomyces sp. NRRL S-1813]